MAVMPVREVTVLFEGLVGNLQLLLLGLAILVVVVAGIGIMVSIYNTMNDRRRDIAVMRALGAGKQTVMIVILFESLLLSLGGGLAGLVLGHGLIALLNPLIIDQTGVSIGLLQFQQGELALVPGLIVLATVAGIVPALAAYRTDVSKALAASP
jgi:putative ABC transport system permease protein